MAFFNRYEIALLYRVLFWMYTLEVTDDKTVPMRTFHGNL